MAWVSLVIFLGISVGHVAILSYSYNWWFGLALPHKLLAAVRLVHGLVVLIGVVGFGRAFVLSLAAGTYWLDDGPWQGLAGLYALACAVVGFILLPFFTCRKRLRPQPRVLLSNHTRMIDFEHALGYKPVGRGRYRWLAHLPGNEIFQVDFIERQLQLAQLPPAWNGLSILHLTDFHFAGTPDKVFYQLVMDECQRWQPDILAFTGDLVDSDVHHRWILPVLGRLRWKTAAFAILGNHDSWHDSMLLRRRIEKLGIMMLGNTWRQVEIRGQPLVVVGHEGPWFAPEPDLRDCPAGPFRLCLSHTPDNISWARSNKMDLVLAGHVHGGQIRFPLIGSVLVPSKYSRRYDCGVFHEPPTVMHVGRGLGGQHPVRFGCRPEVTLIQLRSAPAGP